MPQLNELISNRENLLGDATEGKLRFDSSLPVSPNSNFGDDVWDWNSDNRSRLNSLSPAKLRIDWRRYDPSQKECDGRTLYASQSFLPVLTPEIIHDLKRAAFVQILSPSSLGGRRGAVKPNTLVAHLGHLIKFIGHLRREHPEISILSDITVSDIEHGLKDYPYGQSLLPRVLKNLSHYHVSSNLKFGLISFNKIDVDQIKWPPREESTPYSTLPRDLFRFLSDTSCNLVGQFLCAHGTEPHDQTISNEKVRNQHPRFPEMFESYIGRRKIIRERGAQHVRTHTSQYKSNFGVLPRQLSDFLYRVQTAAQVVVLMYTGMRYSEVVGLKRGCLTYRDGFNVLKSTVVKHKSNDLPADYDEWIATDVVADAINCLEIISEATFNRFLFSGFDTVKNEEEGCALSNTGLSSRLRKYLITIDENDEWADWDLHPHSFRHTLVHLLARAEVGLPYITRHLKHAHMRLSYIPDSVTIGYGNLKYFILAKATGIKEARTEMLQNIYGENARVAGAGAAKHVERTEDFFRGIGVSGEDRDDYLARLAESGVPMVPTGFGLCGCNHADVEAVEKDPPPCYGDYRCRPDICEHAVITEDSIPSIQKRYEHACKQVEAPDQAHARKHWISVRDSLKELLDSVQS